MALKAMVIKDC